MGRAQAGDAGAFADLVRRHQTRTYRLAVRMVGAADADDAAQEALVSAWRALGGFRGDAAFGSWLHGITVHVCLRVLRRRRPTVALPEHDLAVGPGAATDDLAMGRIGLDQLGVAVAGLDPDHRAAWALRDLEGLAYVEIAAVLDVSLATVRTRIHRARRVLVERLTLGEHAS